ncbi:hypothetical protein ACLI4Z_10365 [Natrialbaceae archaeon A-arb3/5]
MRTNRRQTLTAVGGVSAGILAGCLESQSEDTQQDETEQNGDDEDGGEWQQFDLTERDITYEFPESKTISYESEQPADVTETQAYRRGEDVEIRGTIRFNEDIPLLIEIDAEMHGDGEHLGGPSAAVRQEADEEPFTLEFSSTRLDVYEGYTLHVTGPDPE